MKKITGAPLLSDQLTTGHDLAAAAADQAYKWFTFAQRYRLLMFRLFEGGLMGAIPEG